MNNMRNATSGPRCVGASQYRSRPRTIKHGFKIVAVIFSVGLAFSLARHSAQQEGLLGATANPGDVMTGIDYYPAQFSNSAAGQLPEQHIQAF